MSRTLAYIVSVSVSRLTWKERCRTAGRLSFHSILFSSFDRSSLPRFSRVFYIGYFRCLFVELIAVLCHLNEKIAGCEWCSVSLLESQHVVHDVGGRHGIRETEGTAAHGREAEAKHCADVTLQGSLQDSILQKEKKKTKTLFVCC